MFFFNLNFKISDHAKDFMSKPSSMVLYLINNTKAFKTVRKIHVNRSSYRC